MSIDFKSFIQNPVTVSFRVEYSQDLIVIVNIFMQLAAVGHIINFTTHLNMGGLPILEPFVELTCAEETLQLVVKEMTNADTELHIALDTMARVPLGDDGSLHRTYGKGEFC